MLCCCFCCSNEYQPEPTSPRKQLIAKVPELLDQKKNPPPPQPEQRFQVWVWFLGATTFGHIWKLTWIKSSCCWNVQTSSGGSWCRFLVLFPVVPFGSLWNGRFWFWWWLIYSLESIYSFPSKANQMTEAQPHRFTPVFVGFPPFSSPSLYSLTFR